MSNPDIITFFTTDHRACDEEWAAIEQAVDKGEEAKASELFRAFDAHMRQHFDNEEQVLFPALENATGMHGGGPTHVMRAEHQQMRSVLDQMAREAQAGNLQTMVDHGDTLLMLTQQHNVKEENILYPMAEQSLAQDWPELSKRLQR